MNNENIDKLTELKQRFETLYADNIQKINLESLIKNCEEYLNYKNNSSTSNGKMKDLEGNIALSISGIIKEATNIQHNPYALNLKGIIELLEQKIQSLSIG